MSISIVLDRKSIIRESGKAINLNIAGFDCWIPKKFIEINKHQININVDETFTFKLQKYYPQENIIKNRSEIIKLINEHNAINKAFTKKQLQLEKDNEEYLFHFENFNLSEISMEDIAKE